jgi:hypothetical protein
MNRERLLKVATALRESPHAELFTMTRYAAWGRPCDALGHYASRSDLQSAFKLSRFRDRVYTAAGKRVFWYSPEVLEHFGLSCDEAEHLFSGDGCNEAQLPEDAATYVERFLAGDSDLTRTVRLFSERPRRARVTGVVLRARFPCAET